MIISLILTGCGGEDGKKETSNDYNGSSEEVTLSAKDATYSTGFEPTYFVDLSEEVSSSDGSGFILTEVQPLSREDECQVESYTETGFAIEASNSKVCTYSYSVEPRVQAVSSSQMYSDNGSTSALARVAVSSAPTDTELTPISNVTLINSDIATNIKDELEKTGFTLGSEFELTNVTLPYGYASTAEASSTDDRVINYSPAPGFTGLDRILYTYEDVTNGLVLMGTLDIAVAYEANEGFTINENIEYSDPIEVNIPTDIDISQFVTSDDGDDYQLVYLATFDATVTPKDPLDTSNKVITFKASEPGYYYVSFAVSDHNGTYDIGLIKVRVFDPNLSADWSDINYGAFKYTAPITVAQAENEMVEYSDGFLDDNGFKIARFLATTNMQATGAESYCASLGGTIATINGTGDDGLVQLGQNSLAVDAGWPMSQRYLAIDGYIRSVDLTNGTYSKVSNTNLYVTCAIDNVISIDNANSDFEAVANSVDKAKISVNIASNSIPTVGALVSISTDSDYVSIDAASGKTNEDGNITFFLDNARSESVIATIDYNGRTITQEVKFTAEQSSANITLNVPNNIISASDVADISSTLKDGFNNDLVDEPINFEVSSPARVTATSDITYDDIDEEFKAEAAVNLPDPAPSSKGTAAYTSFSVTASYTLPSGDRVSAVGELKYATGIGHGIEISPVAVEHCLTDGVINQEFIDANCLTYDAYKDNFGFESGNTFIYFDTDEGIPTSITAYGYWRHSINYYEEPGLTSIFGKWQLLGCNDSSCSDNDVLLDDFGLSFEQMVPIYTSNQYSRYKLVFIDGPVNRNGAIGGGNFSEIEIGYEPTSDLCVATEGDCIKIAENDGKLYTSTPSVSFLRAAGYGDYKGTFVESGSYGPSGGTFARFNFTQANKLCELYNTLNLNGRDDWALANKDQLSSLDTNVGNMYIVEGWAASVIYWTSTPSDSSYYNVSLLNNGVSYTYGDVNGSYASCVSGS